MYCTQRRHRETGNPGNFLSMLKVIANYDHILKAHLVKPRQKNATYISSKIQNEIIDINGKEIILRSIIEEIQKAKFFSVMVDEVTSYNKEHVPLCIRFVDSKKSIREEFIQFSTLIRVTGKSIAEQICDDLKLLNLDIKNIRGHGYDGASSMCSDRTGVQSHIRKESPLAIYTHRSGHCLNLVISHSSRLPAKRNVLDRMKAVCQFYLNSPKRNELLSEIVTKSVGDTCIRKPLIDLCRTCWAERHSAYQHFYQCYTFIIKSLEVISLGLHCNELSQNFVNAFWDTRSKSTATSLLHSILDFEFIVVFMIAYQFLSHLSGMTIKLQSSTIEAYDQVNEIVALNKNIRSNVSGEFHII